MSPYELERTTEALVDAISDLADVIPEDDEAIAAYNATLRPLEQLCALLQEVSP